MANPEHLDLLQEEEGAWKVWNPWRRKYPAIQPDLSGVYLSEFDLSSIDLSNANLRDADLSDANLTGADLSNANLSGATLDLADLSDANLTGADLTGANLCGSILSEANLNQAKLIGANLGMVDFKSADVFSRSAHGADLQGASLREADLSWANLSGVLLTGADLSSTILSQTILNDIDLSTVKGLVEIDYRGPSRVELHTMKLPQDGSALHFLRGIGVPDEWINFYRSSMMSPIQYHSCFISYAHQDEMLANRVHADLQDHGVRCWFAPEDMKIGDKIRPRIDEAIHLQDKLLLLLSKHAIASLWVEDEVEVALEKEQRQQREVLFPVRLDESVMQTSQAWAAKLRRTRHIGDFTHWMDTQAYQEAFERLLRNLKAESNSEREIDG